MQTKLPEEVEIIRYANRLAGAAHVEVMQACKPGKRWRCGLIDGSCRVLHRQVQEVMRAVWGRDKGGEVAAHVEVMQACKPGKEWALGVEGRWGRGKGQWYTPLAGGGRGRGGGEGGQAEGAGAVHVQVMQSCKTGKEWGIT